MVYQMPKDNLNNHLAVSSMNESANTTSDRRGKGGHDSHLQSGKQRRYRDEEVKSVSTNRKRSLSSKKNTSSFESPTSMSIQLPVLTTSPPPPPSPSRRFVSPFNKKMKRAPNRSTDDSTSDNQGDELDFPQLVLDDQTLSIYPNDEVQSEDFEVWRIHHSSRQQQPKLKPRFGAKNPFGELSLILR